MQQMFLYSSFSIKKNVLVSSSGFMQILGNLNKNG